MIWNNNIYRSIFIWIAMISFAHLISACMEDQSDSKDKTDKILEYVARPDQEMVALLAIKYKRDAETIEKILDIYLTDTDIVYKKAKLKFQQKKDKDLYSGNENMLELYALDKTFYANEISKLSNQFPINPTIIASIIMDYRTWDTVIETWAKCQ